MPIDRLQTIRRYSASGEARLAESVLQQQNLNCIVTGETNLGAYGATLYQVELRVSQRDAAAANAILTDIEEFQTDEGSGSQSPESRFDWLCETCEERSPASFAECWSCGAPVSPDARRIAAEEFPALEEIVGSTPIDGEWMQDDDSPFRPPAANNVTFRMTRHHDLVNRAMRCTMFALLFPPAALYALYLIHKCLIAGKPPLRIYFALIVCLSWIAAGCTLILPITG